MHCSSFPNRNTIENVPATWGTLSAAVKSRFQKKWMSDFKSVSATCVHLIEKPPFCLVGSLAACYASAVV